MYQLESHRDGALLLMAMRMVQSLILKGGYRILDAFVKVCCYFCLVFNATHLEFHFRFRKTITIHGIRIGSQALVHSHEVLIAPHVADEKKHCHRCGVRDDSRYDSVVFNGTKVMCCYDCTRATSRRSECKSGTAYPFERFYDCPPACTGCKYHYKPRSEFTRLTAVDAKKRRAETHANSTASAVPRHFCQIPLDRITSTPISKTTTVCKW